MTGTVINFRIKRLAHRAPAVPLAISDDDRAYVLRHLDAVAEAFGVKAVPDVALSLLPANAFVRHLGDLHARCRAQDLEQRLALGRLESVLRLVESAVTVMIERGSRRSA
jgi:hypothetical protein